jgi:hypothetical protein
VRALKFDVFRGNEGAFSGKSTLCEATVDRAVIDRLLEPLKAIRIPPFPGEEATFLTAPTTVLKSAQVLSRRRVKFKNPIANR